MDRPIGVPAPAEPPPPASPAPDPPIVALLAGLLRVRIEGRGTVTPREGPPEAAGPAAGP